MRYLKKEEIEGLRQLFLDMDMDASGTITLDELISGLDRHGAHVARSEVEALMAVRWTGMIYDIAERISPPPLRARSRGGGGCFLRLPWKPTVQSSSETPSILSLSIRLFHPVCTPRARHDA